MYDKIYKMKQTVGKWALSVPAPHRTPESSWLNEHQQEVGQHGNYSSEIIYNNKRQNTLKLNLNTDNKPSKRNRVLTPELLILQCQHQNY